LLSEIRICLFAALEIRFLGCGSGLNTSSFSLYTIWLLHALPGVNRSLAEIVSIEDFFEGVWSGIFSLFLELGLSRFWDEAVFGESFCILCLVEGCRRGWTRLLLSGIYSSPVV